MMAGMRLRHDIQAIILTAAIVALTAACGSSAAVDEGTVGAPAGTATAPSSAQPPASIAQPAETVPLQVWLRRDGMIWPVVRHVPATPAVGRAAIQALLEGPTPAESANGVGTVIPAG